MRAAISQLNMSARAYHRILKLARTIADLPNLRSSCWRSISKFPRPNMPISSTWLSHIC
ncbi:MAG TPA: hypothetical protein VN843_33495 [Anaerolineales bacterium]|nr:hypothetical protein [Anaerolineales bacterium]